MLNARELVAVVGRSGSSKSTLLRVLTGVYPISSGQCLINGYDVQQLSESELRSRVIYLDADCTSLPDELSRSLDEPLERSGPRWISSELDRLLGTEGLMVALDQPELWLRQAVPNRDYGETIRALANRHLVVVATREETIVNLADRMLVMESAICRESLDFHTRHSQATPPEQPALTSP